MSDFFYERLSELDGSFLIYEGPNSPMHVAAVQIYEAAPLRGKGRALELERIIEYVNSRLYHIPRYRQRVAHAPVDGHPIWVDDARFNLRYHVRHSRLPPPANERTLKRTCARILEQRLDLHKPLWELWVVEGLEGDRVALVSKTHHCMIDGISGVDLLSVLMTPEPTEKIDPPPVWIPRRPPTALEYVSAEANRRLAAPLRAARALGNLVTNEAHARSALRERLSAAGRFLSTIFAGSTPTPINQPVGPHRRFDWLAMSLDEIDRVRERLGGTLNDVVLATTAGAMRKFLKHGRQTPVDRLKFKVMAPVSLREASERGRLGNRVTAWLVPLPIAERDPVKRLVAVRKTTERLKQSHEALGADAVGQVVEWMGSTPIALGARLFEQNQPPFNLVVTNVPGPRQPLYLLGAPMLEAHPWVPLFGQLSVGIALFSYLRTLSWGFTADWDLMPDLHDLVGAVEEAFSELKHAAERAHHDAAEKPAEGARGKLRRARSSG
ncbi:MAG TPA: wax ester/triacylglycerol synthase family O-acyltransferase [Myxococcota bacterium]|nr:wax ester/triacylglycerol synthase family O-acyltransferase [Myxococcota bacterium]